MIPMSLGSELLDNRKPHSLQHGRGEKINWDLLGLQKHDDEERKINARKHTNPLYCVDTTLKNWEGTSSVSC